MSATSILRFSALDTWFFRESRPMETIGGSELASVFPPPPRTLMGSVRTAIGDALKADWPAFGEKPDDYRLPDGRRLKDLIGFGDDCGPLSLNGPWLVSGGQRLYPVPFCLFEKCEGTAKTMVRLRIGPARQTSLGKVRLPELPPRNAGAKTMERTWISGGGLACILSGGLPASDTIHRFSDLFTEEARLGIARDNAQRVTGEGLLYQTRHLRPRRPDLAVEAEIPVPDGVSISDRLVRLGGEGRLAHIELRPADSSLPPAPKFHPNAHGLILILLTSARLGRGPDGWLPFDFREQEKNGLSVWKGRVAGVDLTLHAAVIGKARREGGWNMAEKKPRSVFSLIPAGSCYYVTTEQDRAEAIHKLHGTRIGREQELGRGLIACGIWNNNESKR